jgi:hypothetical protein
MVGLTAILREAWNTSQQAQDKREKIQALSLAKECYSMKLDLLTNATVVDDAIRFVSQKSKEKARSLDDSNEDEKEQLKEPDYDEDQLEEEQEEEAGEITATTNEVF